MVNFTVHDIRTLADEIGEQLDSYDAELGLSALMTAIAVLCAQCADDKAEFAAILSRVARGLTAGHLCTASTAH